MQLSLYTTFSNYYAGLTQVNTCFCNKAGCYVTLHHTCEININLQNRIHLSNPGAQQADADLAVVIQVWIEAAAALRQVAEQRRHSWVDVWQLDVKQEETVLVGRTSRPFDQSGEQVLCGRQTCFMMYAV